MDEEGNQIQGIAHEGARPFNKEELERIDRAGTCIACHDAEEDVWKEFSLKTGVDGAPNDDLHRKAIRKAFRKTAGR